MEIARSVEELFGTLQQSVTEVWRKHLKTSKYSKHMALDEFYKEMPEKVDKLIEDYIGHKGGKLDTYSNILDPESMDALEYLTTLHDLCKAGREDFLDGESELESDMDDIISFIDGVIYKIRELKEGMIGLTQFMNESKQKTTHMKELRDLLNESLNEASYDTISIDAFCDGLTNHSLEEEYEWPKDIADYCYQNCSCVAPSGGYNDDGSSWMSDLGLEGRLDAMGDGETDMRDELVAHLLKHIPELKDAAKEVGRPKLMGSWFSSGFENPGVVFFKNKDTKAKDVMKHIEELM